MKNTKKFAAMIAALTLSACSIAPMFVMNASAEAVAGKITFTNETPGDHTYKAYKILSGTAESSAFNEAKAELTNPEWADTTKGEAFLTALKADSKLGTLFADCTTAAGVAEVLGSTEFASHERDFADFTLTQTANLVAIESLDNVTEDGYYVIEETKIENGGAKTMHILGVYDAETGAEITAKSAIPTFTKKIMDTDDSGLDNDGSTNGVWQDSADYDIGDKVPFQLKATLPSKYDDYKHYTLVFHDDLQASVYALDTDSFEVYYMNGENKVEITGYSLTPSGLGENTNFTNEKTEHIEDFTLTLVDLKAIDGITKDTEIFVEYKATLTESANIGSTGNWNSGYLEYSNNPNWEGSGTPGETPGDEDKSKTPEEIVVAFTYQLSVDKVDGTDKPLPGAGFTLYKEVDGNWTEIKVIAPSEDSKPTTFNFEGIDAGKYKLEETIVPNGYNKADDLTFIVKAEHDEKAEVPTLKTLKVYNEHDEEISASELAAGKFQVTLDPGLAATKIVNNSGAELPSTGGIGTTIFYLGGGAMVAVAGVFLITKKRMGKQEN